jgi:hypothetical protein
MLACRSVLTLTNVNIAIKWYREIWQSCGTWNKWSHQLMSANLMRGLCLSGNTATSKQDYSTAVGGAIGTHHSQCSHGYLPAPCTGAWHRRALPVPKCCGQPIAIPEQSYTLLLLCSSLPFCRGQSCKKFSMLLFNTSQWLEFGSFQSAFLGSTCLCWKSDHTGTARGSLIVLSYFGYVKHVKYW